jgi:hypothetical protein
VSGTAYYRVKQIDFNGDYSYSDIVLVKGNTKDKQPIVSYSIDKLGYVVSGDKVRDLKVTNMNGELKYAASGYATEQVIPALAPGIYLVQIQTTTETYYQKVLMR